MAGKDFYGDAVPEAKVKHTPPDAPPIQGVGVLRYPDRVYEADGKNIRAVDLANEIAQGIRSGSIITLPSDRNENGEYAWDFRIEGGDPGQVRVERSDKP